ncbi:MAG: orotidine-5'-phosphate decarboxylase [Succinivibrionaceae bacterium]|nr:orotidine-5'-phosphate decarboxylase [Succinivibrionaceae bacterium]
MKESKVIVALDYNQESDALKFVDSVDPSLCRLKVGKEMFTYFGPAFVKKLIERRFEVFLDLKFHDIPNTVASAVRAAAELGVWMVNVHASGGAKMMTAAREILEPYGSDAPLLTAVTVLTSMDQEQLAAVGIERQVRDQVCLLAQLAGKCGLDGVVCSAQEAPMLRQIMGKDFLLVTPGIRPLNAAVGDQSRVVTPKQAVLNGSSYLVIGRPITRAEDPNEVLRQILAETSEAQE